METLGISPGAAPAYCLCPSYGLGEGGCPVASAVLLNLSRLASTDPRGQETQLTSPEVSLG